MESKRKALDDIELACLRNEISLALLEQAQELEGSPGGHAARSRFLVANVQYRLNQEDESLKGFQQAEIMAIREGDRRTQALAVMRQVEWAIFHERWNDAERRWSESFWLLDDLNEPYQRARPRQARGHILNARKHWSEASRWFAQAAPLYEQAGSPKEAEKCINSAKKSFLRGAILEGVEPDITPEEQRLTAELYLDAAMNEEKPEKALDFARRALEIPTLSPEDRALLLTDCIKRYLDLGDTHNARKALEAARACPAQDNEIRSLIEMNAIALALSVGEAISPEQEARLLDDPSFLELAEEEVTYLNRALIWIRRGLLERALEELERAVVALRARPDGEISSFASNALQVHQLRAHCLMLLGRWSQAIEAMEEAEKFEEHVPRMARATLHFRWAFLLLVLDIPHDAEGSFLEVVKMLREVEPPPPLSLLSLALAARSAFFLGATERCDKYTQAISEELEATELSPIAEALLRHSRGLITRSVEDFIRASECCVTAGLLTDAADMMDDAALAYEADCNEEAAIQTSRRTTALLDEALTFAPDDESRVGLCARVRSRRANLVRLLWETSPEEALAEVIWAKGAALLALLSLRWSARPDRPAVPCSYGYSVHNSERWLAQAGDSLALRAAPAPAIDLDAVRLLYRELTAFDEVASRLSKERSISVRTILEAIPEDAVLIEWFSEGDTLFGFLARSGKLHPFRVTLPDSFDESLESLRLIACSGQAVGRTEKRIVQAVLQRLYELLVAPWLHLASGVSQLLLCPDGRLAGVPFAALGPSGGPSLLDRFELTSLLSSSQITGTSSPAIRDPGVFALVRGEDGERALPWASSEMETLASLGQRYGWSVQIASENARLAEVEQVIQKAQVWHFAGHAGFIEQHGMAAYLATPERSWTAAELLGLDLRGLQLAVLSACETGRGEHHGDEHVGLLRALHAAGAATIVCSRWPAADASTARLATLFYEEWFRGARASAALRQAQLQLRNEAHLHPEEFPWSWANFAVYGPS